MHIVVVDPSRVALKVISGQLTARGHEVSCFTDSSEALACIAGNEQINALITSLEVRPINGFELCWHTRLLANANRSIYIIAMSSLQNTRNLSKVLDCGADDFISKPPVVEELHARLRVAQRLNAMQRQLIALATTDPLTGLSNRRAFLDQMQHAAEKSCDSGGFSFVMFDIDHFKSINDRHGHDVGDIALQAVAREAAKEGSSVGRLGGEEFGVLYLGRDKSAACQLADQLRLRLSELLIEADTVSFQLTCSFGVSEWETWETVSALIKRADMALYRAKTEGRNRVVAS